MQPEDEGIRVVRDVRRKISEEFGHDAARLVGHYIQEQDRFRERLLPSAAAQQRDAADGASRRG